MAAKKSFSQNISTEAINPFFSQPAEEDPAELDTFEDLKEEQPVEKGRTVFPGRNLVPDLSKYSIGLTSAVYPTPEEIAQHGGHAPFKRIPVEPIIDDKPQKEAKSRRVQLLIKPSLYDAMEKIAYMRRQSKNDLINDLISELAEKEQDSIEKYDAMFPKE